MLPIKTHFPRWLSTAVLKFQTLLGHLVFLWKTWDLRTLILVSLGLQVFLILFGPFRKKTANFMLVSTVWLAYLMADYVAIQAVSLIPNYSTTHAAVTPHRDLLAFWAPFLLVHLGGPDPITALALEDNELWLRTMLHLFTSVYATGRVFFQSLPTSDLFIPTMLMFFAGFVKYLERALSMYYARLAQLRTTIEEERKFHRIWCVDKHIVNPVKVLGDNKRGQSLSMKMGWMADTFFHIYKLLYVDLTLNKNDWMNGRNLFQHPLMTAEKAFTIVEMELNFTYEVFYTKMVVIHKKFGIIIRCASFLFQVVSLVVWILFIDKHLFHGLDIWITYTLLVGAVVIDSVTFLMVALSDWQMSRVTEKDKIRSFLYDKLSSARNRTWGALLGPKESPHWPRIRRLFFRRWSDSVYQFNVMHYSFLHLELLYPIKKQCGRLSYVSNKWFANNLRDFIFDEIKCKSEFAQDLNDTEKMCDSKGEWVLNSLATPSLGLGLDLSVFNQWITKFKYEECLMMWHIATELIYQTTFGETSNYSSREEKDYPKYCKTLSDYMMYLFCWQPGMVSSATGNVIDISFQVVANSLWDTWIKMNVDKEMNDIYEREKTPELKLRSTCRRLMDLSTDTMPDYMNVDRNGLVMYEAARLAKELKKLEERLMWEVMAKVWVELMCYSATNCKANIHATQLKQGGELLTLVWLLMVHFGLNKRYRS